jgi:hypothetical protein
MKTYKELTEELLPESYGFNLSSSFTTLLDYFEETDKIDKRDKVILTFAITLAAMALPEIGGWLSRTFLPKIKRWARNLGSNKEIHRNEVEKLVQEVEKEMYNIESEEFVDYMKNTIDVYSNRLRGGAYDKVELNNMKKDLLANLDLIHTKKKLQGDEVEGASYSSSKYRSNRR